MAASGTVASDYQRLHRSAALVNQPRMWIVGNWKMHGIGEVLAEIAAVARGRWPAHVNVAICPPFTLLERAARTTAGSRVAIGAQDVHANTQGAHTGDVSAAMLLDAGATMVIIGHSERRADGGETDATARAKATTALAAGLTTILCVGETGAERDRGDALAVVASQLAGSLPDAREQLIVAYEPVWAIGTGRIPTLGDVATMHAAIRAQVGAGVPILYGGSVNAGNAAGLLSLGHVDGALVGGASLKAASLLAIIEAASGCVADAA